MIFTYTRNFDKALARLSPKIKKVLAMRLRLFENEPSHPLLNNHALHGPLADYRSINITGDYRAIYQIRDNSHYHFIDIGRHNELYGK